MYTKFAFGHQVDDQMQMFLLHMLKPYIIIQCGDASHDSFKGDAEISYIETP